MKMKTKTPVLITLVLLITSLISLSCLAQEMIHGVTKAFNPKTETLLLQTSQGEITAHLSQDVDIYVKLRRGEEKITETWEFLKNNLFQGTKVTVEVIEQQVTTIIVVEVPH